MTDGLAPDKVPVANKYSWRGFANSINAYFMRKMGIKPFKKQPQELYFLALAFGGEAGELQNVIKKIWRDGLLPEHIEKAKKELADCDIYLQHIADWLGVQRDVNAAQKVNECLDRWPDIPREQIYEE